VPDKSAVTPGNRVAWSALQAVGVIFLVLGVFEIVQNWVPLRVGEPEWELGTTSHFFDTFPLLGLGLAVLISSGLAAGRRWQVRTFATWCHPRGGDVAGADPLDHGAAPGAQGGEQSGGAADHQEVGDEDGGAGADLPLCPALAGGCGVAGLGAPGGPIVPRSLG
jgi:hypothetical protein